MAKPNWLQNLGDIMLAAQTTSPTSVTGGDAFGPRAMAEFRKGNVKKAQEIQKQDDVRSLNAMVVGASIAALPVSAASIGWVPTLAAEAAGWAGSFGAGYLGDKADQKLGTNWIGPTARIAGGMLGGASVMRSSPVVLKRMWNKAKTLDWTPEGISLPDVAPKWKWAGMTRNGSYSNGVVFTPLYTRKSQIAHELGHHVGDIGVSKPFMVKGAYTPGYEYAEDIDPDLNAAENFADHVKTKLGYPYKGRNKNLSKRQKALNNNESQFFDVVKPDGRAYESKNTSGLKIMDLNGIKKVNVTLGDPDKYWYVGHQTSSQHFPSIHQNGLHTNSGLNGTATHLSEEFVNNFANGRLKQLHQSHEGADGLVIMKFPKSKFPSADLDDISVRLMDLGESKSFEVPSNYISFYKRTQW